MFEDYLKKLPFSDRETNLKCIEYWIAKHFCLESIELSHEIKNILLSPSQQQKLIQSPNLDAIERDFIQSIVKQQIAPEILARFFEFEMNSIKASSTHKKNHGAFYTPEYIIKQMLHDTLPTTIIEKFTPIWPDYVEVIEKINSKQEIIPKWSEKQIDEIVQIMKNIRIVDNSCGCGDFLVCLTNELFAFWQKVFYIMNQNNLGYKIFQKTILDRNPNRKSFDSLNWAEFKTNSYWIRTIFQFIYHYNLFGIEIDTHALQITHIRLLLEYQLHLSNCHDTTFHLTDSVAFNLKNRSGLSPSPSFSESEDHYTIIIGNPPYGNLLSSEEKQQIFDYKFGFTKDIASLFVEQSMRTLEMGGRIAYVLPKSIAFYSLWESARTEILKYQIEKIVDLGKAFDNVNAEQIILIIHKYPIGEKTEDRINIAQANPLRKILNIKTFQNTGVIPQTLLLTHKKLLFKPLSDIEESVITYIQLHTQKFRMVYRSAFRGIYISDEVKTQFQPGASLWINRIPDIQRFRIKKIQAIDLSAVKVKNAKKWSQITIPRLFFKVLRGKRLTCFLDPTGELITTEKLVNIELPKDSHYNIFALFVFLNAKLPSYYLEKMLFSEDTETSRVMDDPYIGEVPIPKTFKSQKVLIQLAYFLLILSSTEMNYIENKNSIQLIDNKILDPLVYWEYFEDEYSKSNDIFLRSLGTIHFSITQMDFDKWWKEYLMYLRNPKVSSQFIDKTSQLIKQISAELPNILQIFEQNQLSQIIPHYPWIIEIEKIFNTKNLK